MDNLTHDFVGSRLDHDIESLLAAIEIQSDTINLNRYLTINYTIDTY